MVSIDKNEIRDAYEDVRDDNSETTWAVLGNDDQTIRVLAKGIEFNAIKEHLTDDCRVFIFIRVVTGDELSKRAKFALITWCGNKVSPLKRARTSADRSLVKEVVQNYAVDFMFSEMSEMNLDSIRDELVKAGGAAYGTGERH